MGGSVGSGQLVFSDIYELDKIVQHTGMLHSRNLLVSWLRESFSRDTEYRYLSDIFGYPKTPSHLGLGQDAGYQNDQSTRIFIGTQYRYDITYLPAITVRASRLAYKPISFNQNEGVVHYGFQSVRDGYGNVSTIKVPEYLVSSGAWDGSYEIKVSSKSLEDTLAIADIVMITLQNRYRLDLQRNGFFIKNMSAGPETSENINNNDPLFHTSISLEAYTEWTRKIPIANLVDRIKLCFDIDVLATDLPANDLSIHFDLE